MRNDYEVFAVHAVRQRTEAGKMDYFQGVVGEYLRADRAMFINPEFQLQLDGNPNTPPKNGHWYVDFLAVHMKARTAYLCEVTYSASQASLVNKLHAWANNWTYLHGALQRDAGIGKDWRVRPWLFVPVAFVPKLVVKLPEMTVAPKITTLEMTHPWQFCTWNRTGEHRKPDCIPEEMR